MFEILVSGGLGAVRASVRPLLLCRARPAEYTPFRRTELLPSRTPPCATRPRCPYFGGTSATWKVHRAWSVAASFTAIVVHAVPTTTCLLPCVLLDRLSLHHVSLILRHCVVKLHGPDDCSLVLIRTPCGGPRVDTLRYRRRHGTLLHARTVWRPLTSTRQFDRKNNYSRGQC